MACDENKGIGRDQKIPWFIPADLRYFKEQTVGKGNNSVVMGRVTYESLPVKFLPDRRNIVVSKSLGNQDGITVVSSVKHALDASGDSEVVWFIGGAAIYREVLQSFSVDEMHITRIKGNYNCDRFVDPPLNNWRIVETRNLSAEAVAYIYKPLRNSKDYP